MALGIEPGASHMVGEYSAAELYFQPGFDFFFFFETLLYCCFPWWLQHFRRPSQYTLDQTSPHPHQQSSVFVQGTHILQGWLVFLFLAICVSVAVLCESWVVLFCFLLLLNCRSLFSLLTHWLAAFSVFSRWAFLSIVFFVAWKFFSDGFPSDFCFYCLCFMGHNGKSFPLQVDSHLDTGQGRDIVKKAGSSPLLSACSGFQTLYY